MSRRSNRIDRKHLQEGLHLDRRLQASRAPTRPSRSTHNAGARACTGKAPERAWFGASVNPRLDRLGRTHRRGRRHPNRTHRRRSRATTPHCRSDPRQRPRPCGGSFAPPTNGWRAPGRSRAVHPAVPAPRDSAAMRERGRDRFRGRVVASLAWTVSVDPSSRHRQQDSLAHRRLHDKRAAVPRRLNRFRPGRGVVSEVVRRESAAVISYGADDPVRERSFIESCGSLPTASKDRAKERLDPSILASSDKSPHPSAPPWMRRARR